MNIQTAGRVALLLTVASTASSSAEWTLARRGVATAAVVVSASARPEEKLAAAVWVQLRHENAR